MAVVVALQRGDQPGSERYLAALERHRSTEGGWRSLALALEGCLVEGLEAAWSGGWQPADLARLVDRRLGGRHRRYTVDLIAVDSSHYSDACLDPRWLAQVQGLGARLWWDPAAPHLHHWHAREGITASEGMFCGLELLACLTRLPALPQLCPPPGAQPRSRRAGAGRSKAQSAVDGAGLRVLDRVRALLAKAESTTFPEEAEAFTAKAQELIARHSIDRAMIDSAGGAGAGAGVPIGVRIGVDDPYASPKSLLLARVASANDCQAVWSRDLGFTTVMGFENDLDSVEMLYTSLLVQATSAMVAAGPQVDWRGRSRTRSFRHSFLVAYAGRIGERLRAARLAGEESAAEAYGDALLPVLADRSEAVTGVRRSTFPQTTKTVYRATNPAGYHAGRAAADLAWLSPRAELPADVA